MLINVIENSLNIAIDILSKFSDPGIFFITIGTPVALFVVAIKFLKPKKLWYRILLPFIFFALYCIVALLIYSLFDSLDVYDSIGVAIMASVSFIVLMPFYLGITLRKQELVYVLGFLAMLNLMQYFGSNNIFFSKFEGIVFFTIFFPISYFVSFYLGQFLKTILKIGKEVEDSATLRTSFVQKIILATFVVSWCLNVFSIIRYF